MNLLRPGVHAPARHAVHGFIVCLLACTASVQAIAAPTVPPFAARFESVIDDGEIEGHRVSILRFSSSRTVDEVLAEMERNSGAAGATPRVESASGPWRILSHHGETGYRTLQIRPLPGRGSEGLYSVWTSGATRTRRGPDLATLLPSSAWSVRRFASLDSGSRTETLVGVSTDSTERLQAHLHARALAFGFAPALAVRAHGPGTARLYRRNGQELAFTVSRVRGRSGLVIHLLEANP